MNIKLILFIIFIFFSCAKENILLEEDLSLEFERAMKYYNKGKYVRAKDKFDNIILFNPGSKLANDAQYYMAESMFQLEEYSESSSAFDRYVRFASSLVNMEKSRYRMCQCAINLSNSFQRDQTQTQSAITQLQIFIEDFPDSDFLLDAEEAIRLLRVKLARKDYESGRLYLKREEYDAALIYFQSVLNEYYDTEVADDARIGIMFTHILNKNYPGALSYFNSQNGRFLSEAKYLQANDLIQETKTGLRFGHYFQLYR